MTALTLHRTDPARRMRRFYLLDVQPDLFAQWSFIPSLTIRRRSIITRRLSVSRGHRVRLRHSAPCPPPFHRS